MPLKFYQSFDIKGKDFEKLFCVECTRNGGSVDTLNFCVGCEGLFCYQCLQDHTGKDGILPLPVKDNVTSTVYKQAAESAGNNNNNIRYNNNYSKTDQNFHPLTETKHNLLSLKKRLNKTIDHDKAESQRRLEKILEDVDRKIAELKTKVMNFLEDFQTNTIEEIQQCHHRIEKFYSEKERSVQILLTKTNVTLTHLQEATARNNTEQLTEFAEQIIAEAINVIDDPDNYHADILNKATWAEIDNTNAMFEQSMDDFLCKVNALSRGELTEDKLRDSHKSVCQVYGVEAPTDTKECDINGSCVMPDGTIMLTDWNNTNIKRLDKKYHVTDTCDLPGIPWAICCSTKEEVAVSLHFLQKIQFVSLRGDKMILTDSFKVKHKCRGVVCADNKIFVSCGGGGLLEGRGQVQLYTRNGNLLETFNIDTIGKDLFSCPQHITITSDMSRLYVADKNLGLQTIDLCKKMPIVPNVRAQSNRKPAEAKGVCLTDDSNILMCDFIQNEVVLHRNTDGLVQEDKMLLDRKDGISNPQSLCYNKNNSTLIVTRGNTNFIQVYKLKTN